MKTELLEKLNIKANKCISTAGLKSDKMYIALKNRTDDGVANMHRNYEATLKKQNPRDKMIDNQLKEQGKLRILLSDQQRSRMTGTGKQTSILENCIHDHNRRVKNVVEQLNAEDPQSTKHIKMHNILDKEDKRLSPFKSPSRVHLQHYDDKRKEAPPVTKYNANQDYILKN